MKIREKCLHLVKRDSSVKFIHSLKVIKINLKLFDQLNRTEQQSIVDAPYFSPNMLLNKLYEERVS